MSTTLQIIVAAFSVTGYLVGHLHAWLASPIGQDVTKALGQIADNNTLLAGHAKLQRLARGGAKVAQALPAVDAALHAGASNEPELEKLLDAARAAWAARKKAA